MILPEDMPPTRPLARAVGQPTRPSARAVGDRMTYHVGTWSASRMTYHVGTWSANMQSWMTHSMGTRQPGTRMTHCMGTGQTCVRYRMIHRMDTWE